MKYLLLIITLGLLITGSAEATVIQPQTERVFTCSSNYRPLTMDQPGSQLRAGGHRLPILTTERVRLRHSSVTTYGFGRGITLVEGRTYRVIVNEGSAEVRYRDHCGEDGR